MRTGAGAATVNTASFSALHVVPLRVRARTFVVAPIAIGVV
jgi:hypothetical protein